MDSFRVSAKDTELLEASHLVEEMQSYLDGEMFPVLIGTHIGYFHDIDGGYHRNEGYHVVNLIHRVQGPDSPPSHIYNDTIELHLDGQYFYLEVADIWTMDEYPDDDFVLSLKVTGYHHGPQSFSEAMSEEVDKRETRFKPDA